MERKYKQTILIKQTDGKTVEHSFTVRDGASLRVLAPLDSTSDLEFITGMENGDIVFCNDTGTLYMYSLTNPASTVDEEMYGWAEVGCLIPDLSAINHKLQTLTNELNDLRKQVEGK